MEGLGRGLAQLLGSNLLENFREIPSNSVEVNPYQPRRDFALDEIMELADSIKIHGLLQPILVRVLRDDKYQLISGERRLRACKFLGMDKIKSIILDLDDKQIAEVSLVENVQRENLNPFEEATAYKRLQEDFNYSQEKIAKVVAKSRSHVANMLRLLNLPLNILERLRTGELTMSKARALLSLAKDDDGNLLNEIKDLNVRETENFVRHKKAKVFYDDMAEDLIRLVDLFSTNLKAEVNINLKENILNIKFKDLEDLERIMVKLC